MATEKIDSPANIKQFHPNRPITNIMLLIWQSRKDLQLAFDLQTNVGQEHYIAWYDVSVKRESVPPPLNFTESSKCSFVCGEQSKKSPSSSFYLRLTRLEPHLARAVQWLPTIVRNKARDVWFQLMAKVVIATVKSVHPEMKPPLRDEVQQPASSEVVQNCLHSGVNLVGYAHTESGMGEHVRMSVAAFSKTDVPFSVVNFNVGILSRQNALLPHGLLDNSSRYKVNLLHVNADQMLTTYLNFGKEFFEQKYNIGYPFWELSTFPQEWVPAMQLLLDEVWAPSTFIQEALVKALGRSVPYLPVSTVLPKVAKMGRDYFGIPLDHYVFFCSFDFLSFIDRKNPWAIVKAFKKAFPTGRERVNLIIKVMNASESAEGWQKLIRDIGADKRIRLINETMDRSALLSMKLECDCYISLHRAEGLGRGPLEAMLLGKPVIVTNYSGNTDFTNSNNACLVNYSLIPVQEGQYIFHENQVWADPDVDHAAWHMKRLANSPEIGMSLGEKASEFVGAHFSPVRCGYLYKQRLQEQGLL